MGRKSYCVPGDAYGTMYSSGKRAVALAEIANSLPVLAVRLTPKSNVKDHPC